MGLEANASVVSNGMLGWIAGDDESIFEAQLEMSRSKAMAEQIRLNIAKRAIVFPTGAEVEAGEIEDTNTPFIMQKLTEAGFTVDKGEVMKDDLRLFTAGLSRAAEMGYGLCITTGGVGAENKRFQRGSHSASGQQCCGSLHRKVPCRPRQTQQRRYSHLRGSGGCYNLCCSARTSTTRLSSALMLSLKASATAGAKKLSRLPLPAFSGLASREKLAEKHH